MEVAINWWAVLLATVASMVVGSVWYAKPVFGKAWMKLIGKTDEDLKKAGAKPMIIAVLVGFITAYVLAHVTYLSYSFFTTSSFLEAALTTAFWVWLGFTATRVMMHHAFEGRPTKLTAITVGHELVALLVMGAVIGLLGVPSV